MQIKQELQSGTVRWQLGEPNEKQKLFFKARERFVAYGGARGGGKSWAVRKKAVLLCLRYAGLRVMILRRTFPELYKNHIEPLTADTFGMAAYTDKTKDLKFSNRSVIHFDYCDSERDVNHFQGQEYDVIFVDEATHFTESQMAAVRATLRGANDFPKRMYFTCNPGGVGHQWVKRLFIDREYREGEDPAEYVFIPARVEDNAALMQSDPEYERELRRLPEDLRRAWLEGDWNVFAGQYFTEWRDTVHVVEPFAAPGHWRRYFTMDYGLDMLAGYWIAVDEEGFAYVYREIYRANLIVSEAARLIRRSTPAEERIDVWLAPPDMWNRRQDTGRSVAELFAGEGIYLTAARNDREAGWMDLKEWLKPVRGEDGKERARLRVFRGCENLIRCMPALQYDPVRQNDAGKEPHEYTHGPDALRYFAAGRPAAAQVREEREPERMEEAQQWDELLEYEG